MTATAPNPTQLPLDAMLDYDDWDDEPANDDDRDEWDRKVLQIEALIRRLPLSDLNNVADYVISLVKQLPNAGISATMLISEEVLARDWNSPEDDEAWGSLIEAMSSTSLFRTLTSAM